MKRELRTNEKEKRIMNIAMFVGNITRNAELKKVSKNGEERAVANFSIAVNEGFGDNKKTTYVSCALWGKRAESLAQYLTKGLKVSVVGRIEARAYQTKDNELRADLMLTLNDIELCGGGQRTETQAAPDYDAPAPKAKAKAAPVEEDSLPF
jgi:single-strand DNA-binding protein